MMEPFNFGCWEVEQEMPHWLRVRVLDLLDAAIGACDLNDPCECMRADELLDERLEVMR
jgi:hypothetical protein